MIRPVLLALTLAACSASGPAPGPSPSVVLDAADPDPVPMLVEPVVDTADASCLRDGFAWCCNVVGCWCYPSTECACLAAWGDAGASDYDAAIACSPVAQIGADP